MPRPTNENLGEADAFQHILNSISRQEAAQANFFILVQQQLSDFRDQLGLSPKHGQCDLKAAVNQDLHVPRAPGLAVTDSASPIVVDTDKHVSSGNGHDRSDKTIDLEDEDCSADFSGNEEEEKGNEEENTDTQARPKSRRHSRVNQRQSQAVLQQVNVIQKQSELTMFKNSLVSNQCTHLVNSITFKTLTTVVVLSNCIFVGIETDVRIRHALETGSELDQGAVVDYINLTYTVLFLMELVVRILGYKMHFLNGEERFWNISDAILVLAAVSEYVLSELLADHGISSLRVLRTLRLARTLRILRVMTIFRNLQLMVQGLAQSFMSLLWMIMLLGLALYLVAIVFVSGVSSYVVDAPSQESLIPGDGMDAAQLRMAFERHFRTIPRAMLSVFFSVTGGNDWYDVARPLMNISMVYLILFALFIVLVVFGILNVLNGCFVEAVFSNRDKELMIQAENAKTNVFLRDMADLFHEADTDGNSMLSKEELDEYCLNPRFCAYLSTHALDASDAKTLFSFLDEDGSGEITMDEFALGTLRLKGPARCLDMLKVTNLFDKLHAQLDQVQEALSATS